MSMLNLLPKFCVMQKIKVTLHIKLSFVSYTENNNYLYDNITSIFSNIFNTGIVNIPSIEFKDIPLRLVNDCSINNWYLNFYTVSLEHNFNVYFNNILPWYMQSILPVPTKILFVVLGYRYLPVMFNNYVNPFLNYIIGVLRRIVLYCVYHITKILNLAIRHTVNFVFNHRLLSLLMSLFILLLILLIILIAGTGFSFSNSITTYSDILLYIIRNYILIASGITYYVFGVLTDWFMYQVYVSHTLPGYPITGLIDILYRFVLGFSYLLSIVSGICFTNTVFGFFNLNNWLYFILGSIPGILGSILWDMFSVARMVEHALITAVVRTVLDSLSFLGIVTSTFGLWSLYSERLINQILSVVFGELLYVPVSYLMMLQILVRVLPRSVNGIPRTPNVFLGDFIFWFNNITVTDQAWVNHNRRPLTRQSFYFSILWNATLVIIVFITNPFIEWWTAYVNNSSGSNTVVNTLILFLSSFITIWLTPNLYFFFHNPEDITTFQLLIECLRFFFNVLGYIMLAAIGYNPFWPI